MTFSAGSSVGRGFVVGLSFFFSAEEAAADSFVPVPLTVYVASPDCVAAAPVIVVSHCLVVVLWGVAAATHVVMGDIQT